MNFTRYALPTVAVLFALLLASCASSERLMRISAIQSYTPPKHSRIDGFSSLPASYRQYKTAPADRRNELDFNASLINIWPVFFRGGEYYSALWPMIDGDPYGFAVRPFYNQEGNEYSVLFPFSAWNPVNGDGWVFNTYWNRDAIGSVPLFHYNPNPDGLNYFGPVWYSDYSGGFFPLARFGRGINYVTLAYWNRDYDTMKVTSGGFLPIAHFSPQWNHAGPAWWYRDQNQVLRSGGFFPLARFGRDFNYVLLAFWNRDSDTSKVTYGGFFPVAWFGQQWNIAGPVWWYRNDNLNLSSGGFFPLARIGKEGFNYALLAFWGKSEDTKKSYQGFFPLAYLGEQWNIAGPAWWYRNEDDILQSGGFFPLARFGSGINYAGPAWWYHGPVHSSGGFFPLARFSNTIDPLQYVGPFWYWQDCWGMFPVFRWSDLNITHVGPFWFDRTDDSFGIVPLFRYTNKTSHFLAPLYILASQGNFFLSPLLYYNLLPEEQTISFLGPLFWNNRLERRYNEDFNPIFNWDPVKDNEFSLIGLLGYAGKKTRYAWNQNINLKYEMNDLASIEKNRDLIQYDFARLGFQHGVPENAMEIRNVKQELRKYTHLETDRYFGMVPLFHYEKSPRKHESVQETTFRFLYFLPYYRESQEKTHFSFLGPLFWYEDKKENDLYGRLSGSGSPSGNVRREEFISVALLSNYRKDTVYVNNDRLKTLFKAYKTFDGKMDAAVREKTEQYLKQVDPKLTLPESVTSRRTFLAYLEEIEPSLHLETEINRTGGFLPLLMKSYQDGGYRWFSMAIFSSLDILPAGTKWFSLPLLSSGENTKNKTQFVSVPLMSGYKNVRDDKVVAAPLPLYYSRDRKFGREQAEIIEEKDIFNAERPVKEDLTFALMGLVNGGKSDFLVAKTPGTARNLSALRREIEMHLGHLAREQSLISRIATDRASVEASTFKGERYDTPASCRSLAAKIKKIKPDHLLCYTLSVLADNLEQLARVQKQLAVSEKTILALCSKLKIPCDAKQLADRNSDPAVKGTFQAESGNTAALTFKRNPKGYGTSSPAGQCLTGLRERINKEYLEVRERSRFGAFFASRLSSGQNDSWDVLWLLANGYKINDKEETRVLHYLYRYRREGVQSERLIFPFISTRANGADSRWSFLWRVLDFKTEKGNTSGHILFIPFG